MSLLKYYKGTPACYRLAPNHNIIDSFRNVFANCHLSFCGLVLYIPYKLIILQEPFPWVAVSIQEVQT